MAETETMTTTSGVVLTVPPWAESGRPTPEQWLEWFLYQSKYGQLHVAAYHLSCEAVVDKMRTVMREEHLEALDAEVG